MEKEPEYSPADRAQLQKGLAKPSDFYGEESKGERITTWWRSIWNYASVYPVASRCMLIKSYLKGPSAIWLESREVELERPLTLEELKDGLAIEYGSDTTSTAALGQIKLLSMGNPKFSTIQLYTAEFNKLYSLLNSHDQPVAIDSYISGLLPKIQKEIPVQEGKAWTLHSVRTAAVKAATKCETIDLAYKKFDAISRINNRNSDTRNMTFNNKRFGNNYNNNNKKRTESSTTSSFTKVSLSNINSNAAKENPEEEELPEQQPQIAAVNQNNSNSNGNGRIPPKTGFKLNTEQREKLMKAGRCFHCHQPGHMKPQCTNPAATSFHLNL